MEDKFVVTPDSFTQEQWCEMYVKIVEYAQELKLKIDKSIDILGQYKHLSSPTEKQALEQEEIVSNAYDILKKEIKELKENNNE